MGTTIQTRCACSRHTDGSVLATFLCPTHADQDPCETMALVTGRRRKGSIRRGRCSHCGWRAKQTATHETSAKVPEFGNDTACDNCGDEWATLNDDELCPECAEAKS